MFADPQEAHQPITRKKKKRKNKQKESHNGSLLFYTIRIG
jgi:hypothetical protein